MKKLFLIILALHFPALALAQNGSFDPQRLKESYEAKQRKIDAYVAAKKADTIKKPVKAQNINIRIDTKNGTEKEYTISGFATFRVEGRTYSKKIEGDVDGSAQTTLSTGEKYYVTGFIRLQDGKALLITNIIKNVPGKAPESIGLAETKL